VKFDRAKSASDSYFSARRAARGGDGGSGGGGGGGSGGEEGNRDSPLLVKTSRHGEETDFRCLLLRARHVSSDEFLSCEPVRARTTRAQLELMRPMTTS
jgi:hypothetical protein